MRSLDGKWPSQDAFPCSPLTTGFITCYSFDVLASAVIFRKMSLCKLAHQERKTLCPNPSNLLYVALGALSELH